MGDIRVGGRNDVVLAGRDDKPVMMLANGFGCDQTGRSPRSTQRCSPGSDTAGTSWSAAVTSPTC